MVSHNICLQVSHVSLAKVTRHPLHPVCAIPPATPGVQGCLHICRLLMIVFIVPYSGAHDDTLKDHLMEDLDYSLVPEGGWNKLLIWYGLAEGSRPIARKVIEWGMYVKHLKVRKCNV